MRRTIILLFILFVGMPTLTHAQSAKNALRALKRIEAHFQTGISYVDLTRAVGDAKFEVNLYQESKEASKNIPLTDLIKIMSEYEDSNDIYMETLRGPYRYLDAEFEFTSLMEQKAEQRYFNKIEDGGCLTVDARDTATTPNIMAQESYTDTVQSDPGSTLTITTTTLPEGTVGVAYNQPVSATGGATPYSWMMQLDDNAPYPASQLITGISYGSIYQQGSGSDIWPVTWGNDNNMLTGWGDGGGLEGTDANCRTRLGIERIMNSPPSTLVTTQIYGCTTSGAGCDTGYTSPVPSGCAAVYASGQQGYMHGLLDVASTLYMIANVDDASPYSTQRIYKSTNGGQTFTSVGWNWANTAGLFSPWDFVQFGAGYAGARDNYVYIVGWKNTTNSAIYMARVLKTSIGTQGAYQFFTGTATSPSWGDWASATPIISDTIRHVPSITYNIGLGRYIYTGHRAPLATSDYLAVERVAIFEATEPWGPWSAVDYNNNWLNLEDECSVGLRLPNKWTSSDGKEFYLVYSGCQSPVNYDYWNQTKATITTTPTNAKMPPGLSFNAVSGIVSGIPTLAGTYSWTARVTDIAGNKDTQNLSIVIAPATPGSPLSLHALIAEPECPCQTHQKK